MKVFVDREAQKNLARSEKVYNVQRILLLQTVFFLNCCPLRSLPSFLDSFPRLVSVVCHVDSNRDLSLEIPNAYYFVDSCAVTLNYPVQMICWAKEKR